MTPRYLRRCFLFSCPRSLSVQVLDIPVDLLLSSWLILVGHLLWF